ncbi:hypothetical protein WME94_27620 [Sorangium sp. So ce429]
MPEPGRRHHDPGGAVPQARVAGGRRGRAGSFNAGGPGALGPPLRGGAVEHEHRYQHLLDAVPGSEALAAFLLAPYVEMVDDLGRARRKAPAKKPEAVPGPPFEAGGMP